MYLSLPKVSILIKRGPSTEVALHAGNFIQENQQVYLKSSTLKIINVKNFYECQNKNKIHI